MTSSSSSSSSSSNGGVVSKYGTDDPRLKDIIIKCSNVQECISYLQKHGQKVQTQSQKEEEQELEEQKKSQEKKPLAQYQHQQQNNNHNNHNNDMIRVIIIGFPFDEGCARNGGREGSKEGPNIFRFHIYKIGTLINPELNIDITKNVQIFDGGDIDSTLDYDKAHQRLYETVLDALNYGFIPFVIGGSNDQSYFNALALLDHLTKKTISSTTTTTLTDRKTHTTTTTIVTTTNTLDEDRYPAPNNWNVGVINIDAHLDVRPPKQHLEHSGSPFRMLLENPDFIQSNSIFSEFASQGHQCSIEHSEYIKKHNRGVNDHKILWLTQILRKLEQQDPIKHSIPQQFAEELQRMQKKDYHNHLFVSFDIDSIRSSDCPGVSCPSPIGLTSEEALAMCVEAGKCPSVRLMDCSEFNPKAESYLTGRLVGTMFYHFLLGLAQRNQ